MQITLNTHAAKPLPRLYGIHCSPSVGIAMKEAHGRRINVKEKFFDMYGAVIIAACCIRTF
jgi:hypothetical protein